MDEATGLNQIQCMVRTVRYCLATTTCEKCGHMANKYSTARRTAIDVDMEQPVLLDVTVSVHRCEECERYFRIQPPFLRPDAIYTERVVDKAVDAIVEDGMAYRRATQRMARDFWVQPVEGTLRQWCKARHAGYDFEKDYQAWVVSEFSGVLCVDEVYQDQLALLLAVDPVAENGDRMVGYQLVHGSVSAEDVEAFLLNLKNVGVCPEQVVTDGSSLYPAVLKRVWPSAAHQLCLFHETRRITRAAMRAINEIRRSLPDVSALTSSHTAGGPITEKPPSKEATEAAQRRWFWRRLHRHHCIQQVHELSQQGLSLRAISRQTGHHRKTVKLWLSQPVPTLPDNMPADLVIEEMVLPDKEQRRRDKESRQQMVCQLASEGRSYSAIAQIVGVHRVTVKNWLQKALDSAETDTPLHDFQVAPPLGWESVEEIVHIRELLRQHRFLLVRRQDRLTQDELAIVQELLGSSIGDELQTVHQFVQGWYRIWWTPTGERQTPEDAQKQYDLWFTNAETSGNDAFAKVARQVPPQRFQKIASFLSDPTWEATNNGAERAARAFRHQQSPHYNLRTSETIEAAIVAKACKQKARYLEPATPRFHTCQRGRRPKTSVAA